VSRAPCHPVASFSEGRRSPRGSSRRRSRRAPPRSTRDRSRSPRPPSPRRSAHSKWDRTPPRARSSPTTNTLLSSCKAVEQRASQRVVPANSLSIEQAVRTLTALAVTQSEPSPALDRPRPPARGNHCAQSIARPRVLRPLLPDVDPPSIALALRNDGAVRMPIACDRSIAHHRYGHRSPAHHHGGRVRRRHRSGAGGDARTRWAPERRCSASPSRGFPSSSASAPSPTERAKARSPSSSPFAAPPRQDSRRSTSTDRCT